METEVQTLIDDELFEFIASRESASNAGLTVLDLNLLPEVQ